MLNNSNWEEINIQELWTKLSFVLSKTQPLGIMRYYESKFLFKLGITFHISYNDLDAGVVM